METALVTGMTDAE